MIRLGDEVQDVITGFTGIAISIATYLHGCARICVQPQQLDDNGKIKDTQWFDEPQLMVMKQQKISFRKETKEETGGPKDDPKFSYSITR